jgi:hypothetical protein
LQNLAAVAAVMNEMDMRNEDNRAMFHFKREMQFSIAELRTQKSAHTSKIGAVDSLRMKNQQSNHEKWGKR